MEKWDAAQTVGRDDRRFRWSWSACVSYPEHQKCPPQTIASA